MRHQNSGRTLGRNSSHRHALFNNLVTALIVNGRIETTEAKAKELRMYIDPTLQLAIDVQSILAKGDKATAEEKSQVVHAMRQAAKTVKTKAALSKLFSEVAPTLTSRKGGNTRVLKSRIRKDDAATMALIEIV